MQRQLRKGVGRGRKPSVLVSGKGNRTLNPQTKGSMSVIGCECVQNGGKDEDDLDY